MTVSYQEVFNKLLKPRKGSVNGLHDCLVRQHIRAQTSILSHNWMDNREKDGTQLRIVVHFVEYTDR